jgi:TRAP-type C4-dicarboxylate transport system permease small subunit
MNTPDSPKTPIGPAGWVAIIVLLGFLAWALWYAIHAWNRLAGVGISPAGWIFMGLGAVVTLLVGGGLMALVFYSSRKGKDF